MRVLMTTDAVGGVWTFTQELTAGLLDLGCSVALVSLGGAAAERHWRWAEAMQSRWGESFRFISTGAPLEWMQANEGAFEEAAPLLMRIADEFGAEVLHFNQFCFGAIPAGLPKVITAHSDVLSWAECCRDGVMEESAWLRRYRAFVREGLARADVVVAPTRWMLEALAGYFELPFERCVIPNGRSILPAMRSERRLQAVTAGRLWDEAKNVAMLVDVCSPMPLMLAGEVACDGASAPVSLGIVKLLGSLDEEDVITLFSESALYLCTSKYEPFGLAPLEAALCGCAVLAHDIPSLREVWQEGALYFRDAAALSELLFLLHNDAALLASAQARSYVRGRKYSREKMTLAYLAIFQRFTREKVMADVA